MAVWVYIALAMAALITVLLFLLKFHFSLDLQTPATLKGAAGMSFLWLRREVVLDAARALSSWKDEESGKTEPPHSDLSPPAPSPAPGSDQRGAVRVPDSWIGTAARFREKLKNASLKTALDWKVWQALILFALKSGRRVLGLLHPGIKSLRVGMEDVYDLGRFAAAWSVFTGTFPALACPVEYGFAEKSFSLKARIAGGFSGLGVLAFGFMTLFTFPWGVLGRRFLHSWRNPALNRWQRRVLLP